MKTTGRTAVTDMLAAWRAIHPIRRASIRWRCDVRVYARGMRTVIAHRPGVMVACRASSRTPEDAA